MTEVIVSDRTYDMLAHSGLWRPAAPITKRDAHVIARRLLSEHADALIDGLADEWLCDREDPHASIGRALTKDELDLVLVQLRAAHARLLDAMRDRSLPAALPRTGLRAWSAADAHGPQAE